MVDHGVMLSGRTGFLFVGVFIIVALFYLWTTFSSQRQVKMAAPSEYGHIEEGFVTVHLQHRKEVVKIYFREINPLNDENESEDDEERPVKVDVLLLHGKKFSSKTWKDLKTINILAQSGHRTVAVDLPGYGNSDYIASLEGDTDEYQLARSAFLAHLIESLGLIKPAIVSPSMSGSFSLPLLLYRPHVVGAYIPVAPVHTEKFPMEYYLRTSVPTLIVYGELDKTLGRVSLHNLSYLPVHEVFVLPNASHPAYLDQPDMWHKKLNLFLDTLKL